MLLKLFLIYDNKHMKYIALITMVFLFSCREDITTFDLSANKNVIYIDSTPPSASIFLNGSFIEKLTPDSIVGLQTGTYFLTLRKLGYADTTLEINLEENSKPYFSIKLQE